MSYESQIKDKAIELGFDAVGITTADPIATSHVAYFQQWLEAGCEGEMHYMRRNIEKRFDPAKLLTGAKSVICVALNYRPKAAQTSCLSRTTVRVSNFAQYEDYHPFIKARLFQLAEFIQSQTKAWSGSDTMHSPCGIRSLQGCSKNTCGRDARDPSFKACVDSVPIAERALAQRAGLGFIGRNHMLISPELGNQILLGELITTLELEPDEPMENLSCGDCGRCIRACPTGALGFDGSFDARKCISYQTIEAPTGSAGVSPAVVPPSLAATLNDCDRNKTGTSGHDQRNPQNCGFEAAVPFVSTCGRDGRAPSYIFGCDECILACPHELGKPERKNTDFQYHPEWQELTPQQIQSLTEDEFQKTFAGSGFIRLGLDRLKRNVANIKRT